MFLNLFAFSLKIPDSIGQAGLEATGKVSEQLISQGYWGDMMIFLIAIIVIFLFGFLLDAHNVLIAFISTYVAWLSALFFPYEVIGGGAPFVFEWWFKIVLVIVSIIIIAIVLSATHLMKAYYKYNFLIRWVMAVINGVLYTGLLATVILSVLPINFLTQFSERAMSMFAGEVGRFVWVFLPLVGIFLTRKRRRRPGRPSY